MAFYLGIEVQNGCVRFTLTDEKAPVDLSELTGKTFQIHPISDRYFKLYPVEIHADGQCPVMIAGERCGLKAEHNGKHVWASGD